MSETKVGISAQLDVDVEMRMNIDARDSPDKARSVRQVFRTWMFGSSVRSGPSVGLVLMGQVIKPRK